MFTSNVITADLDGVGSTPEVVTLGRGYTQTQVTITGRDSGNIGVKVKGFGGDVFEDADPAVNLALATERTVVFQDIIDELEFTADVTGTFSVSIIQTLQT